MMSDIGKGGAFDTRMLHIIQHRWVPLTTDRGGSIDKRERSFGGTEPCGRHSANYSFAFY
jgi:hypothetical protein